MSVDRIIKYVIMIGVFIGGGDLLFGERLGFGKKFKEAFDMTGRMMLSIAGIMSLTPLLAVIIRPFVVPFLEAVSVDPAVSGIFLGCDMGGYSLALSLAKNRDVARMMGLVTASMFGGTLTFTLPIGYSILDEERMIFFSKGILFGVLAIPIGSVIAGTMMGIGWWPLLINNIPTTILSVILGLGFVYQQQRFAKIVKIFADIITKIGVVGLIIGCAQYLTGVEFIKEFNEITSSMAIVCGMTIALTGMLPLLDFCTRFTKGLFEKLGKRLGLDAASMSGMIFTMASVVPTLTMMRHMSKRGIIINSAWGVTCAAILGSQLSYVLGVDSEVITPFLTSKFIAGGVAVVGAYFATKNIE